jgi:hypothetical protein
MGTKWEFWGNGRPAVGGYGRRGTGGDALVVGEAMGGGGLV